MAKRKVDSQQAISLPDNIVERIRADIARWRPQLWSDERNYGPACTCGLQDQSAASSGAHFLPADAARCQRHPKEK